MCHARRPLLTSAAILAPNVGRILVLINKLNSESFLELESTSKNENETELSEDQQLTFKSYKGQVFVPTYINDE